MAQRGIHQCEWFANMMGSVGEQGFSVLALNVNGRASFYLECRPFDQDVVEIYSAVDPVNGKMRWPELKNAHGTSIPYVTAMIVRLRFCPSCGTDLDNNVKENREEFDKLAESMLARHPEKGWNK